jgi:hypothetical protein
MRERGGLGSWGFILSSSGSEICHAERNIAAPLDVIGLAQTKIDYIINSLNV